MCFDLLLHPAIIAELPAKNRKFWKILLFAALRSHYQITRQKSQQKKVSQMIQQYCKRELRQQSIKCDRLIYEQILNILINQYQLRINYLINKKRKIEAINTLSNLIEIIQKSENVVTSQIQNQLMLAYWAIALLHKQCHYIAYTKRYAQIALNIAERLQNTEVVAEIKMMIQSISN